MPEDGPNWRRHVVKRTEIIELVIPQAEYASVYTHLTGPGGFHLVSARVIDGGLAVLVVRRTAER